MRLGSLRVRLALWSVLVLSCSLGLAGLLVHLLVSTDLSNRLDAELLAEAKEHELLITSVGLNGDLPNEVIAVISRLRERVGRSAQAADLSGSGIRWPASRALSPSGRSIAGPLHDTPAGEGPYDQVSFRKALAGSREFKSISVGGHLLRLLSYPVVQSGKVALVLQCVRPTAPNERTVADLDRGLTHLTPVALLLAIAGAVFLTGRNLRPIGEMAAAAESITAESLDKRLPVAGDDELGRLAKVFNGMLTGLESSFEIQRRFVADASHELRTPLTAIKANTSLALSAKPTLREYRTALASADRVADRMARLLDDLLLLSRSDAKELAPTMTAVCVEPIVRSVLAMFSRQAEGQGVTLCAAVCSEVAVYGDERYLERILANLVSNALRHTPLGGSVTIAAEVMGEMVMISVSDTGCGISAEHLTHIFERFYRVEAARSRETGGSGLGLSISRSMAEAMGGSVEACSEPGRGTTMRLILTRAALCLSRAEPAMSLGSIEACSDRSGLT